MARLAFMLKTASWIFLVITQVQSLFHETTLIWTEKGLFDSSVRIRGIPGDPDDWLRTGRIAMQSIGRPRDSGAARRSYRIALGFNYAKRRLYFSDIGYKEIFTVRLKTKAEVPNDVSYNVSVERVFSGTSTQVKGLAVDWGSGTIYWTDALYNWITAASVDNYDVYQHIVTTGLDQPIGIAVYPHKGFMFWSDRGAQPKIERASLDGTNRRVIVNTDLRAPTGVTIDYEEDHVYWVDDGKDTIERSDLDGGNRVSFPVDNPDSASPSSHLLFGIAVYKDHIFVSDQLKLSIAIFSKASKRRQGSFKTQLAIPYDIMMYAEDLQKSEHSDCKNLNCDQLCFSTGGGGGKCSCGNGYTLLPDGRTCNSTARFLKPQYVYSVGNKLCSTYVNIPDKEAYPISYDIRCFLEQVTQAEALAFDVRADLLFYSDTAEGTINRVRLEQEEHTSKPISVQSGDVRGLAVDWISSNLYWSDEVKGHIMVSRLDGRFPAILVKGLKKPRGIVVDPFNGSMYWSSSEGIHRSLMDGSRSEVFVGTDIYQPDGMVIDPQERRLYWADNGIPGIDSIFLNGTGRRQIINAPDKKFRDVTVYQDYVAWSDGEASTYYALKSAKAHARPLRGIVHVRTNVSHDILTYDYYLQPTGLGACDQDNGGCDQLCLPTDTGRQCACAIGHQLLADGTTCFSDVKNWEFIVFVDPYHKQLYQLDLQTVGAMPSVSGITLELAEKPVMVTYDPVRHVMYWVDEEANLLKKKTLRHSMAETVVETLPPDTRISALDFSQEDSLLLYVDQNSKAVYALNEQGVKEPFHQTDVLPISLVVDNINRLVVWTAEEAAGTVTIYKSPVRQLTATVVTRLTRTTVTGITIDSEGEFVYWWTSSGVWRCDLEGNNISEVLPGSNQRSIHSVVADKDYIYYSEKKKQAIYRLKIGSRRGVSQPISEDVFSQVTDMKLYKTASNRVPPQPKSKPADTVTDGSPPEGKVKFPAASLHGDSTIDANKVLIIAGVVGVVLLLLLIMGTVLIVHRVRRGKKKQQKKKTQSDNYQPDAHDNPTYMRADDMHRVAQSIRSEQANGTTEAAAAANPVDDDYLYPTKPSTSPFDSIIDSPGGATGTPPEVGSEQPVSEKDNAKLVENLAENTEISVSGSVVTFAPIHGSK